MKAFQQMATTPANKQSAGIDQPTDVTMSRKVGKKKKGKIPPQFLKHLAAKKMAGMSGY